MSDMNITEALGIAGRYVKTFQAFEKIHEVLASAQGALEEASGWLRKRDDLQAQCAQLGEAVQELHEEKEKWELERDRVVLACQESIASHEQQAADTIAKRNAEFDVEIAKIDAAITRANQAAEVTVAQVAAQAMGAEQAFQAKQEDLLCRFEALSEEMQAKHEGKLSVFNAEIEAKEKQLASIKEQIRSLAKGV